MFHHVSILNVKCFTKPGFIQKLILDTVRIVVLISHYLDQETDPLVDSSSEHSSTEALTTPSSTSESTTKQPVAENSPPVIHHKLPRQATTAGKPFR